MGPRSTDRSAGVLDGEPPHLASVTVTHDPDLTALMAQLAALDGQVHERIVVDNSSREQTALGQRVMAAGARWIPLDRNAGLAVAQNRGWRMALDLACTHVLLLDDDSLPCPDMVECQLSALSAADVVGPLIVDSDSGRAAAILVERGGCPRRTSPDSSQGSQASPTGAPLIEVPFLIASGMLIDSRVFDTVGGMHEAYFIDHVDTQWCFRVRAAGYRLAVAPQARLQHRLGDRTTRFWLGRWWTVPWHSPWRHRQMARNTLWLFREQAVPWRWRLFFLLQFIKVATFFLLLTPGRGERAREVLAGLMAGMRGPDSVASRES